MSYLVYERQLLFFRKLSCSNNTILNFRAIVTLPMVRYEALRLASIFNIDLFGNCAAVSIKSAIWCSFISRIVFLANVNSSSRSL